MLIPFEQMPDNSRVWIYQADREFTDAEIAEIETLGNKFFNDWAAHGAPLKSAFKVSHHRFLIISVDESYNKASGCSIDSSVAFVRDLEQKLNVGFFDRTQVAFIYDDQVFIESLSNLKSSVAKGKISESTLTFNNLVSSKGEIDSHWVVPAKSTWLGRYFG